MADDDVYTSESSNHSTISTSTQKKDTRSEENGMNKHDLKNNTNNNNNNNTISNENHLNVDVVNEFVYLLEKSRQLFNGLRDLPQYGKSHWQSYFVRAFDIYTKVWRFQQQHRAILDGSYKLKRWQIGEIASKIGQLYYHYYLRTSESSYLNEAFSFYLAIRMRGYYKRLDDEANRGDLAVKKLRYYARFIVVCILLRRHELVKQLVDELDELVNDYINSYDPDDQIEWQLVLSELSEFIQADQTLSVVQENIGDGESILFAPQHMLLMQEKALSLRLDITELPPPPSLTTSTHYSLLIKEGHILQEVLIVGAKQRQVKFSELTLDMFRMLQAVEREPCDESLAETQNLGLDEMTTIDDVITREALSTAALVQLAQRLKSPHKYVIYKPTTSLFLTYLSAALKELHTPSEVLVPEATSAAAASATKCGNNRSFKGTTAMLVYVSADGIHHMINDQRFSGLLLSGTNNSSSTGTTSSSSNNRENDDGNQNGNDSDANGTDEEIDSAEMKLDGSVDNESTANISSNTSTSNTIYSNDFIPFLRKPMLLIIDSNNNTSHSFANLNCNFFNESFVALISPAEWPTAFQDENRSGSLYTLFLSSPVAGFCRITGLNKEISAPMWSLCRHGVQRILIDIANTFERVKVDDDKTNDYRRLIRFFYDDFSRALILRHTFASLVISLHRAFTSSTHQPTSSPILPPEIVSSRRLLGDVLDLAAALHVRTSFLDLTDLNSIRNQHQKQLQQRELI
ncbi:hypothetical protein SNEBB_008228 [Seison nebaliae]|nr:hypothetical protein SNEBB_008228 [Seison nebaliae]